MATTQLALIGGGTDAIRSIGIDQFFDYLKQQSELGGEVTDAKTAFANVVWIYRCTTLRAQALSGVPFAITDERGEEVEWEFAEALPRLLYAIEAALCLRGASYTLKLRNRYGHKGLQWLNPFTMKPEGDRTGLTHFEQQLQGQGQPKKFKVEEIIYSRLFNPGDDIGPGMAPARVALQPGKIADHANEYLARFFSQGAIPAVILTTEQDVDDEEVKRVRSVWQRLFGGVKKAFGTAVLRKGLKPQVIGSTLKDIVIRPVYQEVRQQVAVAFGVPQTMLEDAANFATAREHKLAFYYETVFPECKLIAADFNEQLFDALGLRFDWQFGQVEAVQQDEATKAQQVVATYNAGLITRDEAREVLGYEVVGEAEGEEELPPEQPEAEEGPSIVKALQPLGQEAIGDLGRWRKLVRRGNLRPFESARIPEWLRKAVLLRLADERFADSALDPCVKAFDRGGAEAGVQKQVQKALGSFVETATEALQAHNATVSVEPLKKALQSVLVTALTGIVADRLLELAVEHGLGLDYADVLIDAAVWARQYSYELVQGITDITQKQLQDVVSQVVNDEITEADAIALLEPMFGAQRAETIAATEVTRALSQAHNYYARELEKRNIPIQERWLTAEDERVCPVCNPLDHTLKDVWGVEFPDGPPAHPNCRCEVVIEHAN